MKRVRFMLEAPGAKKAFVAGDFTDWEKNPRPMRRTDESGLFVANVDLPEGTHEYKYIIDGLWFEDPSTESVPNSFGTRNSIITVGPPTRRKAAA